MGSTQGRHVTATTVVPDNNFFNLPTGVVTPIIVPRLRQLAESYPYKQMLNYILDGFLHGFDIGFQGTFNDPNTRPRNLRSASLHEQQVDLAVRREISRGHTSGPFTSQPFKFTHCSPIGAAPKPDGSVRLILDLSSPRGAAVNEGISQDEFRCTYSSFDDAVQLVTNLGVGAFLAKLDIKHAFRLCPVRPDQWPLLCYRWRELFYVDTRLPFGSRSSPAIFNAFADLLAWIFVYVGGVLFLLHYLDDFFCVNHSARACQDDMGAIQSICDYLGVPLAPEKIVGPAQQLTYLGIEIDSVTQVIRLPQEKLRKLKNLVVEWRSRKKAKKRDLLSLIGFLAFACKVVKPGRMFLRRLIDLSTTVQSLHHYVTLDAEAKADLKWWDDFLPQWNGVELIQSAPVTSDDLRLFTDASSLGFGGLFQTSWFNSTWRHSWEGCHINVKELFAVWVALHTWGDNWANRQIIILTDNKAITQVWSSGTCRDKVIMRLVRKIFFFAAKRNLNILMRHIPGKDNILADFISRFQVKQFKEAMPLADVHPTAFSEEVWHV